MPDNPSSSFFFLNLRATKSVPDPATTFWLGRRAPAQVRQLLERCPQHKATPLHTLDAMAKSLGLGAICVKDEGDRLGLGSFKALGGGYAVAKLVLEWAGKALQREIHHSELTTETVKQAVRDRTVCCATDGNHGRSVAAAARLFGCKAVIFVHRHVSDERRMSMQNLGAEVIEVQGTYDDSVDTCANVALRKGWQVVSDTSWNSDQSIPALVMQGYTVLVDEALAQMEAPPTHVFVQGGVGGLAGAVAGHLADMLGAKRAMVVVVEPERADCLMQSALAGGPQEIAAGSSTIMSMLECFRPSDAAWPILEKYCDAFLTLPEDAAPAIMRRLANPAGTDPPIVAGESGGIGLAGLVAVAQEPDIRRALALDQDSRILTIITEGATAPKSYLEIVGRQPEDIIANTNQNRSLPS